MKITFINYFQSSSLRPGDQLAVEGDILGYEYYHHGIFISHEEDIIDFGSANKLETTVRQVDLLKFTGYGRRRLVRIVYLENQCLPPELVVKNAKELLQNPNKCGPYHLIENNCEHFATKCKTGVAISMQVIERMRECINNPLQMMTYQLIASGVSVGGSSTSLGSCFNVSSGSSGSCGSSSGSSGSCGRC